LTGLPNRRYFDEFVGLLAHGRRAGDAAGILMIDIDRFKALNDTYGHPTGDAVLRGVATAIVSAVREDDVPARFGGEEFVVLLRDPAPGVAVEVGERIRAAVGALDLSELGVPAVSVSVGVAVANGTVALHLAMLAAGIGEGDEVIVPDFTMFSPVLAVLQVGAKPVCVDAERDIWTMDPAAIEAKITDKTRAILAVHIYGHPCDMRAIADIARRRRLVLIEDAAEAHGATVDGRRAGSLSDIACFSFQGAKMPCAARAASF
jgi:diguanylate cyclase (GGDEF)-like protein